MWLKVKREKTKVYLPVVSMNRYFYTLLGVNEKCTFCKILLSDEAIVSLDDLKSIQCDLIVRMYFISYTIFRSFYNAFLYHLKLGKRPLLN